MALTERQNRFVQEYLVDLNATQAAIRAGYSEKSAGTQGCRLLANAEVQQAIQRAMEERQARTGITQDDVVQELKAVAFAQADDGSGSELKYSSKLKALELLGKHLGIFEQRGGGQTGGSDLLESIRRSTGEVIATDELPEIQQAAAAGNELVESAGAS